MTATTYHIESLQDWLTSQLLPAARPHVEATVGDKHFLCKQMRAGQDDSIWEHEVLQLVEIEFQWQVFFFNQKVRGCKSHSNPKGILFHSWHRCHFLSEPLGHPCAKPFSMRTIVSEETAQKKIAVAISYFQTFKARFLTFTCLTCSNMVGR